MNALKKFCSAIGIVLAITVGLGALVAGYLYMFPDNSLFGVRFVQSKNASTVYLNGGTIVSGGLNNDYKRIYIVANGFDINFIYTNGENKGNMILFENTFGYATNDVRKAHLTERSEAMINSVKWNKWTLREPNGMVDKKDSYLNVYLHSGVTYDLMVEGALTCNIKIVKDGSAVANVNSLTVTNTSGKVSVPATIEHLGSVSVESRSPEVDINKDINGNFKLMSSGVGKASVKNVSGVMSIGTPSKKINNPEIEAVNVGALYVNSSAGKINVTTVTGAGAIEGIAAKLDVATANTSVTVGTVTGDVKFVSTGDGKITVGKLSGSVLDGSKVTFNNATFRDVTGNVNITSSSNGKIEVHFADNVDGGKGNVTSSFNHGDVIVRNMQGHANIVAVAYGRGNIDIAFKTLRDASESYPMNIKAYDGNVKIDTSAVAEGNFAVKISNATSVNIRKGTAGGESMTPAPTAPTGGVFTEVGTRTSYPPHNRYFDISTRRALTIIVHIALA